MKEILAGNFDLAIKEIGITATKTYESNTHLDDETQVWELSDDDFKKLCSYKEKDRKDDWGWWRSAEGSNMGAVGPRYNINNHYIRAWDGMHREDILKDNKSSKPDDRYWPERKYRNLLEYFCDEIGASTERNVCALATDLARQNGMTMGQLFKKFEGGQSK